MERTSLMDDFWAVMIGGPTALKEGIHPDDKKIAESIFPFSRALHVFEQLGDYVVIDAGEWKLRVLPNYLSQIPTPKFSFGSHVMSKGKEAIVVAIGWHFKNQKHLYFLDIAGKRQSKYRLEDQIQDAA